MTLEERRPLVGGRPFSYAFLKVLATPYQESNQLEE
jgi:hypothetical protein